MDTYLYPRSSQPLIIKRTPGCYQLKQLCYGCMYITAMLGTLLIISTWQMRFRRNTRPHPPISEIAATPRDVDTVG